MKNKKDKITIGIVGAGRGTELHMLGYQHTSFPIRLKTIVGGNNRERANEAKEKYGIESVTFDFEELLNDPEIDVVDICTPPYVHKDMIIRSLMANKHVICEKPLTGYFGEITDPKPIGYKVPKSKMYECLLKDLEDINQAVNISGKKFMYAENFIYTPAVMKAGEIIRAKKSKILYMKGEESLKGSSSAVAGDWSKTGGGIFIRNGVHPLGAILSLKKQESKARNSKFGVKSVVADMGYAVQTLNEYEHRHIDAHPYDVEDSGTAIVTFLDGTKAVIISTDNLLGGSKNYIELYCNDNAITCKLTMNDAMETYFLDEDGLDNIYLSEMLPSKLGWNKPFIADDILRGYVYEIEDFLECIYYDKEPLSDFTIARDVIKIVYAAYLSAETGEKINFNSLESEVLL